MPIKYRYMTVLDQECGKGNTQINVHVNERVNQIHLNVLNINRFICIIPFFIVFYIFIIYVTTETIAKCLHYLL